MSEIRTKRPPIRLDEKAYRELCKEVLVPFHFVCDFLRGTRLVKVLPTARS
jgi:hypothetical protein